MAQLGMAASMVSSRKAEKAHRMLRCQLQSLGPLRDAHVRRMALVQQANRFPELLLLEAQLERDERRALKAAAHQIHGFRTRKLAKWISSLTRYFPDQSGDGGKKRELPSAALRCASEAFEETVRRRRLINFSDLQTIHRTRVAFKRFRYILETLPAEVSGLSKRELQSLAWYQRKMGNIQDLEVIQTCVSQFLQQRAGAESLLKPFTDYLRRRRTRALWSFRKSVDELFAFWPPKGWATRENAAKSQKL
jgi:CHAD domain-containing protein